MGSITVPSTAHIPATFPIRASTTAHARVKPNRIEYVRRRSDPYLNALFGHGLHTPRCLFIETKRHDLEMWPLPFRAVVDFGRRSGALFAA